MLDLDRQLREFGSFVDEAVAPVRAIEITGPSLLQVPRPWRRHLAIAGIAAVFVVLVIAAVVILDPFGSEAPFIEEPTTIPPTTTIATSTTEASETTVAPTTTQALTSVPPSITWTRIDDPAVFGGPDYQSMTAIESGPTGLIAVGPEWITPTSTDAAVWTSTDGIAWSRFGDDQAVLGGDGFQFPTAIAVGSENVVISGYDCDDDVNWAQGCRGVVWASKDAVTWQRVEADSEVFEGEGIVRILDVIATEDGFVAVGSAVWNSPDGRSWERVFDLEPTMGDNSPGEVMWSVVQTANGYVAAGQHGLFNAAVWTSADGRDWSAIEDEGQFGPASVTFEQIAEVSKHKIVDLLDSGDAILGVGYGRGAQPDSALVWRSTDGAHWEKIAIDRFSNHPFEAMSAVIQTGEWALAAGVHHDVRYVHGAILLWGSNDNGATWSVLPTEGDVLGNYLSDLYPTEVGDITIWNDLLVMVGSRGTGEDVEWHEGWDAAVWIGTIEK